jgi:hypothetical protein
MEGFWRMEDWEWRMENRDWRSKIGLDRWIGMEYNIIRIL